MRVKQGRNERNEDKDVNIVIVTAATAIEDFRSPYDTVALDTMSDLATYLQVSGLHRTLKISMNDLTR